MDAVDCKMEGKTMKALAKENEGISYKYTDYAVPEPSQGELLVRVIRASICGSDYNLYSWNDGIKCIHY